MRRAAGRALEPVTSRRPGRAPPSTLLPLVPSGMKPPLARGVNDVTLDATGGPTMTDRPASGGEIGEPELSPAAGHLGLHLVGHPDLRRPLACPFLRQLVCGVDA